MGLATEMSRSSLLPLVQGRALAPAVSAFSPGYGTGAKVSGLNVPPFSPGWYKQPGLKGAPGCATWPPLLVSVVATNRD